MGIQDQIVHGNATTDSGKKFSRMEGMGCSDGDEHGACTHALLLVRLYRQNLETEHLLDNIPPLDPFTKSRVFVISISEFANQIVSPSFISLIQTLPT